MNIGNIINNRYKIIESLSNGMGSTFLGEDLSNNQSVVIKMRRLKNLSDWKVLELFEREIDTLRELEHDRIPKYIDSFTIEEPNDSAYYLIQEYIEGATLAERILSDRVFTEAEVINIIKECLDILKYLHEFHPPIIHRDINPSNLVIAPNNHVYLIDFGAVKDILHGNTKNTTIVGTYGYMPIEQTMGKATKASDIYALGMTSIFLLTGKNPSKLNVTRGKPDFASYCDISESLSQTLNLMIEPVLEDRLQNVEEVYNELRLLKIENSYLQKNANKSTGKNNLDLKKKKYKDIIKEYDDNLIEKEEEKNNKSDEDDIILSDDVNDEYEEEYLETALEKKYPDFVENNSIFRNQTVKDISSRDLERYVDRIYIPFEYSKLRLWKDFDSMTFYFKSNKYPSYKENKPLHSSILLIPLIMLFVYIGTETFIEPFIIFALIIPLFLVFFRSIRLKNTNSIQLKNNYLKIIRYKKNIPESRIIGYNDIKDIYLKEVDNRRKIVIFLKTGSIVEVEADLKKEELEWIIKRCKEFIKIAIKVS